MGPWHVMNRNLISTKTGKSTWEAETGGGRRSRVSAFCRVSPNEATPTPSPVTSHGRKVGRSGRSTYLEAQQRAAQRVPSRHDRRFPKGPRIAMKRARRVRVQSRPGTCSPSSPSDVNPHTNGKISDRLKRGPSHPWLAQAASTSKPRQPPLPPPGAPSGRHSLALSPITQSKPCHMPATHSNPCQRKIRRTMPLAPELLRRPGVRFQALPTRRSSRAPSAALPRREVRVTFCIR